MMRLSHDPGQDIQARQQIREDTVRAGCTCRPRAAAKDGKAGSVALDRAGIEAASSQYAGDRARQQACTHRLGGARARPRLRAKDHNPMLLEIRSLRFTKGMDALPLRHHRSPVLGERATVAPRGWLHVIPSNVESEDSTVSIGSTASPPRSARWNEEMDERSARRNHETGCHNGPLRPFR